MWKVLAVTELLFLTSPWVEDYINCAFASLSPSRLRSSTLTENMSVSEGFQAMQHLSEMGRNSQRTLTPQLTKGVLTPDKC